MMKIHSYDIYIVTFSGGKDSLATLLWLLLMGVPPSKIELWHHLVDGRESKPLFDWECTEDYCRKVAAHFGITIYYSWLEGGFRREMTRENVAKAPTWFETPSSPDGLIRAGGVSAKTGTRLMFPQVSADLRVRWCSAYLKIDVSRIVLRNDPRFHGKRVLVISGERSQESTGRSRYLQFEPELYTEKLSIDRLRPIQWWNEAQVWAIIKHFGIIVHPCYYLGFSRCSCKFCIFGNANQFASAYYISPNEAGQLYDYETRFGKTLKRDKDLATLIAGGLVYESTLQLHHFRKQAVSHDYYMPVFTDNWRLPAGAFGDSAGPT